MGNNQDLLSVTAFFSVLLHAVIILGISFKLPDIASLPNTDNALDVVLINMSNNEEPEDAETVSTNNNLGGGQHNDEASSPLPWKSINPSPVESVKRVAKREIESSVAKDVILQGDGIQIQTPSPEQIKLATPTKQQGFDKVSTKTQRQLEKERLIAKLNQRWQDYQKRPRRTYLSPTTKQHKAAKYLNDWRKKVEFVGNANYPQQAKTKGLSGSLIIDVAINQNGTINAIKILTPSDHKLLNDAAIRFVRDAAPFDIFPEDLKKTSDIIHITRAFHFLGNNRLASSDASSSRL